MKSILKLPFDYAKIKNEGFFAMLIHWVELF